MTTKWTGQKSPCHRGDDDHDPPRKRVRAYDGNPSDRRSSAPAANGRGHAQISPRGSSGRGAGQQYRHTQSRPGSVSTQHQRSSVSPGRRMGCGRRAVPFEGARGVRLSFNFWQENANFCMENGFANKVLTPQVRKLVLSTIADEPAPAFAEKVPGARKAVVACVSGLSMATAERDMTEGECPFLRTCTSIPVRHSQDPARGTYANAMHVVPSAALMLWEEAPVMKTEEVATVSFPELFRDCEVTFTGIKHPLASGWRTGGWKDDITFHPTSRRTEDRDECATIPAGSPCHPGRPLETVASGSVCGGELIGDSPAEAADDIPTRGAVEPPVCRGKFWRNMKRDAGTYVLKPSPPRGNAVGVDGGDWDWELNLHWDGWSTEVVRIQEVLENGAGQLRFEADDQSLMLTFAYARRLSEEEAELSRRSATCPMPVRVEVSGISPSTPPPTAPASALSSPADNGSTPAVAEPTDKGAHHVVLEAITGATKGDGINQSGRNGSGNAVERASAAEPTSAGDDKGSKVAVRVGVGGDRGSAKAQEKDAVVAGDSTAPANGMTVIKVPVESLDPELYCLTAADRFRLHIPLHVSEEGPEYVSTGDLLPPPSTPAPPRVEQEQEPLESNGKVTARVMEAEEEEEGEIEDGEIEDGEVNAAKDGEVGLLGGGKVEGGESEVAGIIAAAAKVCLKHSDAMEGEEEGEIAATPAARPRASAADEEGKNVPAGAEAGAEVGALPSTLDEGKEKSAPAPAPAVDAQSGGAEDGEILPTNVAANSAGQAGEEKGEVLLTNASTGGSEPGEEGEVSQPGAASGELSHGSEDFPGGKEEAGLGGGARGGGGASVGGGVVDAGREPRATFVVPSTEALCPIPSGPRKGAVILGFDCEMVYVRDGMELARVTFVNVKGEAVYDHLVKPTIPVTNYNTQFSGITEEMLQGVTRTLRDCQREIRTFVSADTFLVGHSIDGDLRALRLVHRRLIDTGVLYPDPRGAPFKMSLKSLTRSLLQRDIQDHEGGHDSSEDAFAALELALLKMHRGPSFGVPPAWAAKPMPTRETIFEALERRRLSSLRCMVFGDLEGQLMAENDAGGVTPLWAAFQVGYRRELDAVWAGRLFRAKSSRGKEDACGMHSDREKNNTVTAAGEDTVLPEITVNAERFGSAREMLQAALVALPTGPDLVWVDFPCEHHDYSSDFDRATSEEDKRWRSLGEVDGALSRLYETLAEGTLMVVVCQGPVPRMLGLTARKKQSQWDVRSEQTEKIVGSKRPRETGFDRLDDEELASASDECLNGMCFFAAK